MEADNDVDVGHGVDVDVADVYHGVDVNHGGQLL